MSPIEQETRRARDMLLDYANKANRSQEDWAPILAAYRESSNGFIWEDVFSVDFPLLRAMRQESACQQAMQALIPFQEEAPDSTKALHKMTAMLCLTQAGANEEHLRTRGQVSREVFERLLAWKNVFSGQDWFAPTLEREMERMRQRHALIHNSLPEPGGLPRVGSLRTFVMPSACRGRRVGQTQWEAWSRPPVEILDPLNEFSGEYLGGMQFSLAVDGASWLIQDAQNAPEEDHRASVEQLLSGPYGESAAQIRALSGDCEVQAGWDASELRVQPPNPSRRQAPR